MTSLWVLYSREKEIDNKTCIHDIILDHAKCYKNMKIILHRMIQEGPSEEVSLNRGLN